MASNTANRKSRSRRRTTPEGPRSSARVTNYQQLRSPLPVMNAVSADEAASIHNAALSILEDLGLSVLNAQALEIYRRGGAYVDENMVFIGRDMVEAALERAGLRIESFDSPRTLEQSAAQIERITGLVDTDQRAKDVSAAMLRPPTDTRTPDPIEAESGRDPSVLLWQAGQIVAGQETLIAELIKEAGFTSHSEALGLGQADYVTLEQVLSDPPDLLLVAGDSLGQRHRALAHLEGTRVHAFDPSLFYCGGPSVAAARAELRKLRADFSSSAP